MALRSPQVSTRLSPPVTRSVSRTGFRHPQPIETSTPLTRRSLQPGMHIETVERVFESADDTDVDLNSSRFVYREHFSVKDMTTMETEMWYDWLIYYARVFRRKYTPSYSSFVNTLYTIALVVMISHYLHDVYKAETSNPQSELYLESMNAKWQNIHQSISEIKTELHQFEEAASRKLEAIDNHLKTIDGWKESAMDQLRIIQVDHTELKNVVQSLKDEFDNERAKTSKVISVEPETPNKTASTTTELQMHGSFQTSPSLRPLPGINVANSLIGASIDETCSSRTASAKDGLLYDMISYVVSFQEGYVLLDREVLSPGEAWCTYDHRPTLTVKLARHVQPTAVSYQHVRWHGIVPNHAPKLYDLVACRSPCCTKWEPIITNCEYKSIEGHDEQEQFCSVPSNLQISPVKHVQFRFRENHGNMKKTCAYLVRVYGEPVDVPKEQLKADDENATVQLDAEIVETAVHTE